MNHIAQTGSSKPFISGTRGNIGGGRLSLQSGNDEISTTIAPQDHRQIDAEHSRLYLLALSNRWPRHELYRQIVPTPPIFVYCSLMLPWVMAKVLGSEVEQTTTYMSSATLPGFSRLTVKYAGLPTIVHAQPKSERKSQDAVQGLLLGSLKDWALQRIEEYIVLENHERDVVEVEVTTKGGEKIIVAAYAYVWRGPSTLLNDRIWDPVQYMKGGD
ncbi:hypothetical protein BKA63DRAFT_570830 [Paraphoma chrysanthemicola]|nr:hypothetical protein BKA63DRAFT_570830 [Paraphoma chrysanthemicola]